MNHQPSRHLPEVVGLPLGRIEDPESALGLLGKHGIEEVRVRIGRRAEDPDALRETIVLATEPAGGEAPSSLVDVIVEDPDPRPRPVIVLALSGWMVAAVLALAWILLG